MLALEAVWEGRGRCRTAKREGQRCGGLEGRARSACVSWVRWGRGDMSACGAASPAGKASQGGNGHSPARKAKVVQERLQPCRKGHGRMGKPTLVRGRLQSCGKGQSCVGVAVDGRTEGGG